MLHTMLHTMLRRRTTSEPSQRRTNRLTVVLAGVGLLAALLSACSTGGTTAAYHCTAPQNPVGCFTTLTFSHSHINPDGQPDIDNDPVAVVTDLLVVPLLCDANCRASSGSGNPAGFVYNYVSLVQQSGGYFIIAGYTSSINATDMLYFWQYKLPGINNGQYTHTFVTVAATGDGGSTLNYKYAEFDILRLVQDYNDLKAGDLILDIMPPYGKYAGQTIWTDLGNTSFHPDLVQLGQAVYGTSGATAQDDFFANTSTWTAPDWPFGGPVREDGTPPGQVQTVDHPTNAGWFIKASQSTNGGMFRVSCC